MNPTERLMRQPPHRRFHEDAPYLGETVGESIGWLRQGRAASQGISVEELLRKQATKDANRHRSKKGRHR